MALRHSFFRRSFGSLYYSNEKWWEVDGSAPLSPNSMLKRKKELIRLTFIVPESELTLDRFSDYYEEIGTEYDSEEEKESVQKSSIKSEELKE